MTITELLAMATKTDDPQAPYRVNEKVLMRGRRDPDLLIPLMPIMGHARFTDARGTLDVYPDEDEE